MRRANVRQRQKHGRFELEGPVRAERLAVREDARQHIGRIGQIQFFGKAAAEQPSPRLEERRRATILERRHRLVVRFVDPVIEHLIIHWYRGEFVRREGCMVSSQERFLNRRLKRIFGSQIPDSHSKNQTPD